MGYKQFCKCYEDIENYEKAKAGNFKGWHCHHRLETHNSDGERRLVDITQKELMALNMYYNRPAEELIFLTDKEHVQLHQTGKKRSEDTRRKMSEAKRGKHLSEDTRRKMSEARKGKLKSEETRRKMKGNKNALGCKRSEEVKKKISETCKSLHWYNNGKINKRAKECPPGFVPGIIK